MKLAHSKFLCGHSIHWWSIRRQSASARSSLTVHAGIIARIIRLLITLLILSAVLFIMLLYLRVAIYIVPVSSIQTSPWLHDDVTVWFVIVTWQQDLDVILCPYQIIIYDISLQGRESDTLQSNESVRIPQMVLRWHKQKD